jgi:formate-dependent nitrite reductase membrane component NrfD
MVSAIIVIDKELTEPELRTIVALERVGGTVSLFAVLLIFIAYYLVRRVRNVQNTFIMFASVANIGASVASIIALDGIYAGKYTPLCQAQSFMFEM